MWTSTWGWTPSPVHMHPPEPDLPLRVDVINGWPLREQFRFDDQKISDDFFRSYNSSPFLTKTSISPLKTLDKLFKSSRVLCMKSNNSSSRNIGGRPPPEILGDRHPHSHLSLRPC